MYVCSQWQEMERLRRRAKRAVDTRASKGRKIRYEVQQKLKSFAAPMLELDQRQCSWTDEAKTELFRSLFASGSDAAPAPTDALQRN